MFPLLPGPTLCSCVPGPLSAEAGLIYAQGALLVARTLLTDYVSLIEGRAGRWIIQQVRQPGHCCWGTAAGASFENGQLAWECACCPKLCRDLPLE